MLSPPCSSSPLSLSFSPDVANVSHLFPRARGECIFSAPSLNFNDVGLPESAYTPRGTRKNVSRYKRVPYTRSPARNSDYANNTCVRARARSLYCARSARFDEKDSPRSARVTHATRTRDESQKIINERDIFEAKNHESIALSFFLKVHGLNNSKTPYTCRDNTLLI